VDKIHHKITVDTVADIRVYVRYIISHSQLSVYYGGSSTMKILITGATGFIGQYLVRQLLLKLKSTDTIYCFVRDLHLLPGDFSKKITPLVGHDIEIEKYADIVLQCEYIYHVGANPRLRNGTGYKKDNIEFTDALISIAESSTKLKRFIFISTNGAVDRSPTDPCNVPLTEKTTPHPSTEYGRSKLVCEEHLINSTLPFTILRPTMVYGPGMREDSHIRIFINAITKAKLFTKIYFPGRVSLIYIDDLIDAILFVSDHPKTLGQIYFISDGQDVRLGQLFNIIGDMLGKPSAYIQIGLGIPVLMQSIRSKLPIMAQNLFSDLLWTSSEKLKSLGFTPKYTQSQGLLKTIHWVSQQNMAKERIAAVTGGASGIGRSLCMRLYAEGYKLIVIDKNEQALQETEKLFSAEIHVADLADERKVKALAGILEKKADDIDILINNAGIGRRELFWKDDIKRQLDVVAVNCLAPMYLTHAVLKKWIASKKNKTIIMMSSSAAFQPLAYMSAYSASKTMLLYFSEGVSEELVRETSGNIEIITICPSGTATNFQRSSGVKRSTNEKLLPSEFVAGRIVQAIGRGSHTIVIGTSGFFMSLMARCIPRQIERSLWGRMMKELR
jgi:nucleoside-diphosphate-sugar epimerase